MGQLIMKKIYSIFLFASIMFLAFTACSSEENNESENVSNSIVEMVPMTFKVSNESESDTRALIDANNIIKWEEQDEISIFDGTNNNKFVLSEGARTSSGAFTGSALPAEKYTAVYPYTEGANLNNDGSVSGVVLPYKQRATAGSFDPKAILMMSKSDSNDKTKLKFKNAISFVKFKTDFDCSKVVLRPIDDNTPLAGKGTLKWIGDEPSIDFTNSTEKSYSITLSGTINAGTTYYIIIPTGTLTAGWNVTFAATSGTVYIRKTTKNFTFKRNKIVDLGNLSKDGNYWENPKTGIVDSTQEVDLGLTITQNGTNYKVIFTKTNLTAYGLATNETDFGDYFAWAATEPWCTSYGYSGGTITPKTWMSGKEDGYTEKNISSYDGSVLNASADAARVILGGNWQIPTTEIFNLLKACTGDWTTKNGVVGYSFKNNKQELFLPAAGIIDEKTFKFIGTLGNYWSNSLTASKSNAYSLSFDSGDTSTPLYEALSSKHRGCPIRPVRLEKTTSE